MGDGHWRKERKTYIFYGVDPCDIGVEDFAYLLGGEFWPEVFRAKDGDDKVNIVRYRLCSYGILDIFVGIAEASELLTENSIVDFESERIYGSLESSYAVIQCKAKGSLGQ